MLEEKLTVLGKRVYLVKLIISTGVFIVHKDVSWFSVLALFKLYRWLWFLLIDPMLKICLPMLSILTLFISCLLLEYDWIEMTLLEKVTYIEFLISVAFILVVTGYGLVLKFTQPIMHEHLRIFNYIADAG